MDEMVKARPIWKAYIKLLRSVEEKLPGCCYTGMGRTESLFYVHPVSKYMTCNLLKPAYVQYLKEVPTSTMTMHYKEEDELVFYKERAPSPALFIIYEFIRSQSGPTLQTRGKMNTHTHRATWAEGFDLLIEYLEAFRDVRYLSAVNEKRIKGCVETYLRITARDSDQVYGVNRFISEARANAIMERKHDEGFWDF